jgi:Ca-activated chloride channel family protein
LTSGPVGEALARAGRVDIATVVWADSAESLRTLGWQVLESPADASRAAARIAALPRPGSGSTDMGNGIDAALDLLEGTAACPGRKVVNVVGDGRESTYPRRRSGPSVHTTRRRAEALGITINALALDSDEKDLADWFLRYVIAGADGFVLSVLDASTFEEAMIRKLVREIEPPVLAAAPAAITGADVGAVTR